MNMAGTRIDLENWKFIKQDVENGSSFDLEDDTWESVIIPHTWNDKDVQDGGGKLWDFGKKKDHGYHRGTGWYRTLVIIPEEEKSQRIFVKFEAIGDISTVYCNGHFIGEHKGAFSAICYEITDYVKLGAKNLIAVMANNEPHKEIPPLGGDFPIMGGIYRPAYILLRNTTCISPVDYASPGIYLSQTEVTGDHAIVGVKVKLDTASTENQNLKAIITVKDAESKVVYTNEEPVVAIANSVTDYTSRFTIGSPHLWNGLKDPYLYSVSVELSTDSEILDTVEQPLGLRYFRVDPEKGFFLNGESYPIYGVARHQDRQDAGWALTKEHQEDDIRLITEMGARGVRLAHYQHNDYFYHLCDTHGQLVWAEISLVGGVQFNEEYWNNASTQLIEMIRQSYNHPSIFCWGLGNELGIQLRDPSRIIRKLHRLAKKEDYTRYTAYAAIMLGSFRKKLNNSSDILATNLYPGWYGKKAEDMAGIVTKWQKLGKNRGIAVSEYGAGASIKHHEWPLAEDWNFKSSWGNWHPEERQTYVHEINFRQLTELPFVWGTFVWNMFDFAVAGRNEGDTPGRNDKGLVTYDRKVRKDAYFFYQANLTETPMVYITSRRWVDRTEAKTFVKVYSTCDMVNLKVNGKDLGAMEKNEMGLFLTQNVSLIAGENHIEVVGRKADQIVSDFCKWNLNS